MKKLKMKGASRFIVRFIDEFVAHYSDITNEGSKIWFKTNKDAPKSKIIQVDLELPDEKNWKTIIAEQKYPLAQAWVAHSTNLIVKFFIDATDVLRWYDLNGKLLLEEFPFPSLGSVSSLTCNKKDSDFFYYFSSFLYPGRIYHYDLKERSYKIYYERKIENDDFDPSLYQVTQIFYESKDKTNIPMFLVSQKGLKLNGENPVYLYGYGGFKYSITPSFSISQFFFVREFNGIVAIPNIRGGGEYKEEWHRAGMLNNKQNVFDDFIAAAEYLIEKKYTQPSKIVIHGVSNGGLLVAAVLNQRPDLFGCVICESGVLDMLRFHQFTIGFHWIAEYGSSDKEEDFKILIAYSPLHTIPEGKAFPAVLVLIGDHDDRVIPCHSLKFIAALQDIIGNKPYQRGGLFLRFDLKTGHGSGTPLAKIIAQYADMFTFIGNALSENKI